MGKEDQTDKKKQIVDALSGRGLAAKNLPIPRTEQPPGFAMYIVAPMRILDKPIPIKHPQP